MGGKKKFPEENRNRMSRRGARHKAIHMAQKRDKVRRATWIPRSGYWGWPRKPCHSRAGKMRKEKFQKRTNRGEGYRGKGGGSRKKNLHSSLERKTLHMEGKTIFGQQKKGQTQKGRSRLSSTVWGGSNTGIHRREKKKEPQPARTVLGKKGKRKGP